MALPGSVSVLAALRGSAEPVCSGAVAPAGGVASPAAFDVAEARRLLNAGTPAKEVAWLYQVSEGWVSKRCPGARKAWIRERNARICELATAGQTQRQIAAAIGCGLATVSRALAAERRDWLRRERAKLRQPRRHWRPPVREIDLGDDPGG